jgi:hypothetical protein
MDSSSTYGSEYRSLPFFLGNRVSFCAEVFLHESYGETLRVYHRSLDRRKRRREDSLIDHLILRIRSSGLGRVGNQAALLKRELETWPIF